MTNDQWTEKQNLEYMTSTSNHQYSLNYFRNWWVGSNWWKPITYWTYMKNKQSSKVLNSNKTWIKLIEKMEK